MTSHCGTANIGGWLLFVSERAEPLYVLEQTPRCVVSALDAVNAQTAFILAVLKAGADIDATNNRSKTALLLALSQLKE